MEHNIKVIAHIQSDFPTKFGIPRQSGIIDTLQAQIVFEPEYRNVDAFRGLEGFSHLWIIWQFSEAVRSDWSPMVRPPRLGGNTKIGVFATRSPFRPNAIGLSSVQLNRIEYHTALGPVLHISGADLMNGSPIYDIKPYLPYTDCHSEASAAFAPAAADYLLEVHINDRLLKLIPPDQQQTLIDILAHDPRPSYQTDNQRIYGMAWKNFNIRFQVDMQKLIVLEINTTA